MMIVKSTSDYAALKEELIAYAHEIGIQKLVSQQQTLFIFKRTITRSGSAGPLQDLNIR